MTMAVHAFGRAVISIRMSCNCRKRRRSSPRIFELPVAPKTSVADFGQQLPLGIEEVTFGGRSITLPRERERIGHEVQLIAHGSGLELIAPFEALEPFNRLQGSVEQEAKALKVVP